MVAVLIRLKLTLLRNHLRRDAWQALAVVLGLVLAAVSALVGFSVTALLRGQGVADARTAVVLGGSLLVLGWAVLPVIMFGVDETLDPDRFALLPLCGRRLVPGMLLAAAIGGPGAATAVVCLGTVVTWSRGVLPVLFALVSAVTALLTCVVTSRVITTAASGVLSGRRGREGATAAAVVVLSAAGVLPLLTGEAWRAAGLTLDMLRDLAEVLAWTPLGLLWAAPADAAAGRPGLGLLRLVLALAVLALGVALWGTLLDRAMTTPRTRTRDSVRGGGWIDRLPEGQVWTIAGRGLRYRRRDPRYVTLMVGLLMLLVVPVAVGLSQPGFGRVLLLGTGPYAALMVGFMSGNDVGYDGSAYAAHMLIGVRGRVDRTGRVLATLLWAGPVVVATTVGACLLNGRPALIPAMLGVVLATLLGTTGAASVSGALAPQPLPPAGTSPFRANTGASVRIMLAQLAVMGFTVGVVAPPALALVVTMTLWAPAGWVGLLLGAAFGGAALVGGVAVAGRLADLRGPEILAVVGREY